MAEEIKNDKTAQAFFKEWLVRLSDNTRLAGRIERASPSNEYSLYVIHAGMSERFLSVQKRCNSNHHRTQNASLERYPDRRRKDEAAENCGRDRESGSDADQSLLAILQRKEGEI